MKNKITVIVLSLALVVTLAACSSGSALNAASSLVGSQPQQTTPAPSTRTITVADSGEISVTPDIAYINIGVQTQGADVKEALSQNNTKVQGVIDALTAQGVAAKDIQTSSFNIYPSQQYDNNGVITGTTYIVDNTVYITVRNLNSLGDLLDTVVSSGANSINGITFDVADKTSAEGQARTDALNNAKAQAEGIASAIGVNLGQVVSVSTSVATNVYSVYGRGGGADTAAMAVPISSGQVTVTASVTVVYEIQ